MSEVIINPFVAMKSSGLEFPLRTSLFTMREDGGRRGNWEVMSRDLPRHEVTYVFKKLKEYNANFFTHYVFSPTCGVNPLIGNPTAAEVMSGHDKWDLAECARWYETLQPFTDPALCDFPTIFCGDDYDSTRNEAFHEYMLPAFVMGFDQYTRIAKGFNIASEAGKTMGIDLQTRMIRRMRQYTKLPIVVQNQGVNISPEADGLMYESKNHPMNGDSVSVDALEKEIEWVMGHYNKYVIVHEINWNPEGEHCRKQCKRLMQMAQSEPRLIGVPVPL
jgi:hypothetical protein